MQLVDLSGCWELSYFHDTDFPHNPSALKNTAKETIPANVPGNVELDMMAAGILPDISKANNIYLLREYESYHWWYQKTFVCPQLPESQKIILCFEGLDTIADIWLNGEQIGHSENMFIAHNFDITDKLIPGENKLMVHISPAVLEGRKYQSQPGEFAMEQSWESIPLRKSPYMFGWDIMPRAVTAGIWRKVHIYAQPQIGINHIAYDTLRVDTTNNTAEIIFDCDIRNTASANLDGYQLALRLEHNGDIRFENRYRLFGHHTRKNIQIENAQFWWPAGVGEANLYDCHAELISPEGEIVDSNKTRFGIRTVALNHTDSLDENGNGEFVFLINGQRIFIRGTNWVPLDIFPSRANIHMPQALGMLKDLNCNMVRCWGGGYYEDHDFYDFCDENGIMVWQDFMLACAAYPQEEWFQKAIEQEATYIVGKLRNHPSIVLWAGNNENDEAYEWSGYNLDPNDVDIISRKTLKKVATRLSPKTPYLPSSPYRSRTFYANGNDFHSLPEVHLWSDRNDFKSPYYKDNRAKFISEIGYHGCPNRSTLERMFDAEFIWPWQDNDQWLTRATRPIMGLEICNYRIPLMDKNIRTWFGESLQNLDDFILASQFCQAEAMKFFIENSRMQKFNKTGILWWNLRDGWPVISDAVVDYYNTPKLAYHHIKKSQSLLCVMVSEAENHKHKVMAVNDTIEECHGSLSIYDAVSKMALFEGKFSVAPNGKTEICELPEEDSPHLWLLNWKTSEHSDGKNHYVAGQRPYDIALIKEWIETRLQDDYNFAR